jgi:SAM-dependent methyltransferase
MAHDGTPPGDVAGYYAAKLKAHGATPQGVDWNGEHSHAVRHHQFLRLIGDARDASLIDLGCGFGDFYRFLRAHEFSGHYAGYDIAPEMIAQARALHGEGPRCRWEVSGVPEAPADFAIASGVFNVKGEVDDAAWAGYVRDTIVLLARCSRRGFAFNVLSLSSDPERRRATLFYADPVATLQACLNDYGRQVALLQDYGLYEFTIIVRHP